MSIRDWLLLAPIVGYCLWLLLRPRKKGCHGNCQSCKGCPSAGDAKR